MTSDDKFSVEQALHSAHSIVALNDTDRVALFHSLRGTKKLSSTVRTLNILAADPKYRPVALDALNWLGLGTPG